MLGLLRSNGIGYNINIKKENPDFKDVIFVELFNAVPNSKTELRVSSSFKVHYSMVSGNGVNKALVACVKEHKEHPLLSIVWQEHLEQTGQTEVNVPPGNASEEAIGERLHTSLRKYIEGSASTLLWNTIIELGPKDWQMVCARSTAAINKELAGNQSAPRRRLALALKNAWEECAEDIYHHSVKIGENQRLENNKQTTRLTALAFSTGLDYLCDDDWIWGMLHLIVEPV